MGQVALGFKNLLIKVAVFVIMAALLAWVLGGELLPRPEVVDMSPVRFAGKEYFWQLSVGGRQRGRMVWRMMVAEDAGRSHPMDNVLWTEVAGPIVASDGLCYAGRASQDERQLWKLVLVEASGVMTAFPLPDRLAVERQLARLQRGLPVQSAETIDQQRSIVLDPPGPETAAPTEGSE
ncbi:MAG: hypothetical protein JSV91_04265 [Phycisphaerales bacterium]|nr:MAG: hypothetical protein JSV91_04265 [Phycisphaerales bacterium]